MLIIRMSSDGILVLREALSQSAVGSAIEIALEDIGQEKEAVLG